ARRGALDLEVHRAPVARDVERSRKRNLPAAVRELEGRRQAKRGAVPRDPIALLADRLLELVEAEQASLERGVCLAGGAAREGEGQQGAEGEGRPRDRAQAATRPLQHHSLRLDSSYPCRAQRS